MNEHGPRHALGRHWPTLTRVHTHKRPLLGCSTLPWPPRPQGEAAVLPPPHLSDQAGRVWGLRRRQLAPSSPLACFFANWFLLPARDSSAAAFMGVRRRVVSPRNRALLSGRGASRCPPDGLLDPLTPRPPPARPGGRARPPHLLLPRLPARFLATPRPLRPRLARPGSSLRPVATDLSQCPLSRSLACPTHTQGCPPRSGWWPTPAPSQAPVLSRESRPDWTVRRQTPSTVCSQTASPEHVRWRGSCPPRAGAGGPGDLTFASPAGRLRLRCPALLGPRSSLGNVLLLRAIALRPAPRGVRNPRRRSRGSSLGSQLTALCFLPAASRWRLTRTSASVSELLAAGSGHRARLSPARPYGAPGVLTLSDTGLISRWRPSRGPFPAWKRSSAHTFLQEVRSRAALTLTFPRRSPRRPANGCRSKGVTSVSIGTHSDQASVRACLTTLNSSFR